jgi:hypothetical protein
MFLRSFVTSLVVSAAVAAPASAQVKLTLPLEPCYVVAQESQRQAITIAASGFTPFNNVTVLLDEIFQTSTQVLLGGNIEGTVPAPFVDRGTRPFTLRLFEAEKPDNAVVASSLVTRISVDQTPRSASTGQRVRFRGRGFMAAGAPVYAHYVFAGKVRRSVRLSTPTGPCGGFSVRRKQFPFKSPQVGKWTIQFDQHPQYDPKAAVRVPITIRVARMAKPASARAR